eukprot:scaffold33237_cov33-Tisochrysis_lutea.AAC.1
MGERCRALFRSYFARKVDNDARIGNGQISNNLKGTRLKRSWISVKWSPSSHRHAESAQCRAPTTRRCTKSCLFPPFSQHGRDQIRPLPPHLIVGCLENAHFRRLLRWIAIGENSQHRAFGLVQKGTLQQGFHGILTVCISGEDDARPTSGVDTQPVALMDVDVSKKLYVCMLVAEFGQAAVQLWAKQHEQHRPPDTLLGRHCIWGECRAFARDPMDDQNAGPL